MRHSLLCAAPAIIVFAVVWIHFYVGQYAPFGDNTLASHDAKIQYLDLFSYYRDCLRGDNSIFYTFSYGLGTNAFAVFSYYLASPFNLLVLLFPKEAMNDFFDLAVSLKLAAAAGTFSWFLQKMQTMTDMRSEGDAEKILSAGGVCLRPVTMVLLSCGYGLMQYNLAQSSNLMWLDGVIMLPVIMGNITGLASLAAAVAVSILANWYTGAINCLFSLVWLLYLFLDGRLFKAGKVLRKGLARYFAGTTLGIVLSAALLLPNLDALRNGKASAFPVSASLDLSLRGNPLSILANYGIGGISSNDRVALFCGSLAMIGCIGFFLTGRISRRQKTAGAGLLLVTCFLYYWQPFYSLYSLLIHSESYWYRYGYLGSFVLLYLAAAFYGQLEKPRGVLVLSTAIYVGGIVLLHRYWGSLGEINVQKTVRGGLLTGSMLLLACGFSRKRASVLWLALLAVVSTAELWMNAGRLMDSYRADIAGEYASYSRSAQLQIAALKNYAKTSGDEAAGASESNKSEEPMNILRHFYRINQTSHRSTNRDGLTSCYNDALAYNAWSISGYTSCPENTQLEFLDRLGYREEYRSFNIVNISFLPADSLLGVRYILSDYAAPGLVKIEQLGRYNGKEAYENPYALPLALVYNTETAEPAYDQNSFRYLERLYSALVGETVSFFVPLQVKETESEDHITWELSLPASSEENEPAETGETEAKAEEGKEKDPSDRYCLYGNLLWNGEMESVLTVSEDRSFGYGTWLSPSVFYIPWETTEDTVGDTSSATGEMAGDTANITGELVGDTSNAAEEADGTIATVTLRSLDSDAQNLSLQEEQFYALDLEKFAAVTEKICGQAEAVKELEMENGRIHCVVSAESAQEEDQLRQKSAESESKEEAAQSLLLTISDTEGWTVTRNGEKIEPSRFGGCLVSIPLTEGENVIELNYRVPWQSAGLWLSAAGGAIFLALLIKQLQYLFSTQVQICKSAIYK